LLPANDGQSGSFPRSRPASDVDDVDAAGGEQLFARRLPAAALLADDVDGLPGGASGELLKRLAAELIERDVARRRGVNGAKLRGRADVDEFDRLALATAVFEALRGDGGN
jgi:hypothetical protein